MDTLEDAVLVDCFLGNNLTHHEEKLTYSRGYKAAKNVADLLNFVIINDTYNFANMQIKTITEISHTESPTYNAKTIYTLTEDGGKQKFYYVPLPGKTVQTVQPKKDQERFFYGVGEDPTYFFDKVKALTMATTNNIQPDLVSTGEFGVNRMQEAKMHLTQTLLKDLG